MQKKALFRKISGRIVDSIKESLLCFKDKIHAPRHNTGKRTEKKRMLTTIDKDSLKESYVFTDAYDDYEDDDFDEDSGDDFDDFDDDEEDFDDGDSEDDFDDFDEEGDFSDEDDDFDYEDDDLEYDDFDE